MLNLKFGNTYKPNGTTISVKSKYIFEMLDLCYSYKDKLRQLVKLASK